MTAPTGERIPELSRPETATRRALTAPAGEPFRPRRDERGRFTRVVDSEFGPVAAGLVEPQFTEWESPFTLARDLEETGVRAVLAKHSAQLTGSGPPLFDEALAVIESVS